MLLRHPKKSALKLIDLGSACFANQKVYTYIQSRFYRAPEVLLSANYSASIDMWSVKQEEIEAEGGLDAMSSLYAVRLSLCAGPSAV